jgi:hypothetical protein
MSDEIRLIPVRASEVADWKLPGVHPLLRSLADRWDSGLTSEEANRIYLLASEADGLFGRIPSPDKPKIEKLEAFFLSDPEEET